MTYRLKTAIGHFLILFVMYKLSFLNKYIPSDFPKNYYLYPLHMEVRVIYVNHISLGYIILLLSCCLAFNAHWYHKPFFISD